MNKFLKNLKEKFLKIKKILLISLILLLIFILIYIPHLTNPFPIHVDEWRHISESLMIKSGQFHFGIQKSEIGFNFFLIILSYFFDLVLIYKFLPGIWAIISSLTLYYITRKITKDEKNSFLISIFSMIFFASIKSNVNITGLWFFTPLSFSIPLIYFYIYFFTQGIEKENKKYIFLSFLIILFLVFTHAISFLFSIPMFTVYLIFNYKKLKSNLKFFSLFLFIPLIGIIFYKFIMRIPFKDLFPNLFSNLLFRYGWGVLELVNSPFEIYSLVGYVLAFFGLIFLISSKENFRKYLIYIIWPISLIFLIFLYRLTGISPFSPYQRNLYYFALSLPFLSALGINYLFEKINFFISPENKRIINRLIKILFIIIIIFFAFNSYFNLKNEVKLYKAIDKTNYESLKFLSKFEKSKVMSTIEISEAIFPVSGHIPVGTIYFYGNRKAVENFFETSDCKKKEKILKDEKVKYILSPIPIDCNWTLIYYKDNNFVYEYR